MKEGEEYVQLRGLDMVNYCLDAKIKEEFLNILQKRSVEPLYQPIVSLESGVVLGYEALSRGPKKSDFYNPEYMFKIAKEMNMVWELDILCRERAIKEARDGLKNKLLFLNIDSDIINDPKFKKGFTKELLISYGIEPSQIVFEITEHTAIEDFECFNQIFDNYRGQGYKIAIDDAGNGHSGLRLMTETRPNYIKLDMSLIRNIDQEIIKKQLIKSFVTFAKIADITLIAEGIETQDELKALIGIGVPYGQGYLLQRPQPSITPLDDHVLELIKNYNKLRKILSFHKYRISVGDISRQDETLKEWDTCFKVNSVFKCNKNLDGIVISNEKSVIGLIMRNKFYYKMIEQGNEMKFLTKSVTEVMDRNPLIVESGTKLMDVCNMSVSRKQDHLYDYVVVVENEKYYGVVPVAILLYALVALSTLESSKTVHSA